MIIFTDLPKFDPTYTYTEYASVVEEKCRCGAEIKITGSTDYCDKKLKEFTDFKENTDSFEKYPRVFRFARPRQETIL